MKITARKDESGVWRNDANGEKVALGKVGVVYVYSRHAKQSTKRTSSTVSQSRPHVSKNMGIHADQVASFNKKVGPGVQYDKKGACHSTSYAAREREARRRDMSFG